MEGRERKQSSHFDESKYDKVKGLIFNIQRYSIHDGPGIRTLVFMKGCPLRCVWCDNPESHEKYPEVIVYPDKCISCGKCLESCPVGAVTEENLLNRELCTGCGKCVDICPAGARKLIGKYLEVKEVLKEVKKDSAFYKNSGGGIAVGGGEPGLQAVFLEEFFKECRALGIDIVLETCGYCKFEDLRRILKFVSLIYYDIKLMDEKEHQKFTGVSNQLILENARKISSELKIPMIVRIPIVPGLNDSEENIKATAEFVTTLDSVKEIQLLPYHALGAYKYGQLGREYTLSEVKPPSEEEMQRLKRIIESYSVECRVGGV